MTLTIGQEANRGVGIPAGNVFGGCPGELPRWPRRPLPGRGASLDRADPEQRGHRRRGGPPGRTRRSARSSWGDSEAPGPRPGGVDVTADSQLALAFENMDDRRSRRRVLRKLLARGEGEEQELDVALVRERLTQDASGRNGSFCG